MTVNKITPGYVIQTYDDKGQCLSQEFVAGDPVDWETQEGITIDPPEHEYQPFDMVQPHDFK